MKKLFIVLLLLLIVPFHLLAQYNVDSLLICLDKAIQNKAYYESLKESKIEKIKKHILQESHPKNENNHIAQYESFRSLFEEYKNFQMDSALQVADTMIAVSLHNSDVNYQIRARIYYAQIMAFAGMYKESEDILDSLACKEMNTTSLLAYYEMRHALYMLMKEYGITDEMRKKYDSLLMSYKDSILSVVSPSNSVYYSVLSRKLEQQGLVDSAYHVASDCYRNMVEAKENTAIISHIISEIALSKNDTEMHKYFLAASALQDISAGKKEYVALNQLAQTLYEENQIDRAYLYMKSSIEDAVQSNSRFRAYEISRILPIITTTYNMNEAHEKQLLICLVLLISVFVFILALAVIRIYKQLKMINKARIQLRQMNIALQELNNNLNSSNQRLSESDHVKEVYIGSVFSLCSSYIAKMDEYRKSVNRKIKAGQIDDVLKASGSSSSFVANELKEFYKNFDTIFLNLYPRFVADFNELLLPQERVIPKDGEVLTPELRVFALVRLGITDSAKIASFLHYSPQTVYNYRFKIKNKAAGSKEDFTHAVEQLGNL